MSDHTLKRIKVMPDVDRETPVEARVNPPWYRTSYPFMLLAPLFFGLGSIILSLAMLGIAFFNRRSEDWYSHMWPWLLLIPLWGGAIASFAVQLMAGAGIVDMLL